jgi:N-acetylglutamate synthase-like GNAT family acetyltransferase
MVSIRQASVGDLPDVLNVIDGAALSVDVERLREQIAAEDVLVAVEEGRVLGTLALDGDTITAIAVRRRRRGQGIGTALVGAAAARRDRLVAEFDAGVRPFWASLGFEISPAAAPDRFVGVLHEGDDELPAGGE